jgi:hypothetical protein
MGFYVCFAKIKNDYYKSMTICVTTKQFIPNRLIFPSPAQMALFRPLIVGKIGHTPKMA